MSKNPDFLALELRRLVDEEPISRSGLALSLGGGRGKVAATIGDRHSQTIPDELAPFPAEAVERAHELIERAGSGETVEDRYATNRRFVELLTELSMTFQDARQHRCWASQCRRSSPGA